MQKNSKGQTIRTHKHKIPPPWNGPAESQYPKKATDKLKEQTEEFINPNQISLFTLDQLHGQLNNTDYGKL